MEIYIRKVPVVGWGGVGWGGFYERLIGMTRMSLMKTIQKARLNLDESYDNRDGKHIKLPTADLLK